MIEPLIMMGAYAAEPPLLVIGGPTASGKSALALALAEAFGGTIVNADSMQVYRDLRILSARPGATEEARAPHRLFGVIDAAEPCSAARWAAMAEAEIATAHAAGRLPIVAGGTGLYLRALLAGLAAVPPIPAEIRADARRLHRVLGGAGFRATLAARDPGGAAQLAAGDTQRLVRAYEVVHATGRPLAEWQRVSGAPPRHRRVLALVLLPPRAELYAACDARFVAMVEVGALAEVQALLDRHLDPALPAMKAVGVPELARHLSGELTLAEAIRLGQQATRRYAKRQYTWFRHQMADASFSEEQFSESLTGRIFPIIRQFLLTPP